MGMGIENMNLYHQSLQKKNEASFLVRSIARFHEKLDLKETLKSIAEKGAELIGKQCHVYLFSETKVPMIQVTYQKCRGKRSLKSRTSKKIQPKELENFYRLMISQNKPLLIKSINHSKKIGGDIKSYFQKRGIRSFMSVPLRLGRKKVGLLLLSNGRGKRAFDRHDLSVTRALGSAASVAIQNAQAYTASLEMSDFLEKKITEKTSQIQQIQETQKIRVEERKDMIFRVNKRNRFVFVNKAMEILTGCSRDELYRGDVMAEEVVAEEDRDRIRDCFRKILRGELPMVRELEYRHLNRKGEDHLISLSVYPETDQSGRIIALEGVGRDITEKRRLEEELEKAKDLALLGEFSSAVAHQIRNPLGNILMGSKVLQKALGMDVEMLTNEKQYNGQFAHVKSDGKPLARIFCGLSEGIHNLNQIVTELLEYTKTPKLSFSSQKLDIILRETLNLFQDIFEQDRIKVEEYFEPALPPLYVDAVLIGQVFQNIIHNALQAMPDGGYLCLTSGFSHQKPGFASVSISDTGIGIKPSEVGKIFRPFFTTKDSGTGLGLSLAHRITEAHKGMIRVCNNPCSHLVTKPGEHNIGSRIFQSKGVTIHILLPMDDHSKGHLSHQAQGKENGSSDTRG
jgi:PAS domain S-box-containing protein